MSRILGYGLVLAAGAWFATAAPVDGRAKRAGGPGWLAPAPQAPLLPIPAGATTTVSTRYFPITAARAAEPADPRPLVWVVDGAGDLRGCSTALAHADAQVGGRLELCAFPWVHGALPLLRDQTDADHARTQGVRLAKAIRSRQEKEPGRRVVLVAHSAGCTVALAAAEELPPDAIDRLILFAPSVSTEYDVRPALVSAREGVDVFCSKKDWVALGFVTRVVGTSDRLWTRAAGRHGFERDGLTPWESSRLRQHFWTPDVAWTGHTGGHHGMHTPAFLHAYVFPLIGAGA